MLHIVPSDSSRFDHIVRDVMGIHSWSQMKLEEHSVERSYLRQRCSDGSVNETILKPRLVAA